MHASIAQRGQRQIQMAKVPGSKLTGATFLLLDFFLFSHSKACDAIIANFGYFVKMTNESTVSG